MTFQEASAQAGDSDELIDAIAASGKLVHDQIRTFGGDLLARFESDLRGRVRHTPLIPAIIRICQCRNPIGKGV